MTDTVMVDGVPYVRVYPVTETRCPHCGRLDRPVYWTPERIIAALRDWKLQHGRAPMSSEWDKGTSDHPHRRCVEDMFGNWPDAVRAAGLEPHLEPWRGRGKWSAESIHAALLDWTVRNGRPPKQSEWARVGDDHPASSTVRLHCGSWNKALTGAGISELRVAKGGRRRLLVKARTLEGLQRKGAAKHNRLPTARLKPIIDNWVASDPGTNTLQNLASRSGVSARRLEGVRRLDWPRVDFTTFDAVITAIGSDAWYGELSDLYETAAA